MTRLKNELQALEASCADLRSPARVRASLARGCWIYGAGGYGKRVYQALNAAGHKCLGFVDRRAASSDFVAGHGVPVRSPDAFDPTLTAGHTLVVGVMNTLNSFAEPQEWARRQGFQDILLPGHLPASLGPTLTNYWMAERGATGPHIADIVALTEMLADEESKEIIAALARFRISGEVDMHPPVDIEHQYLPAGVPLPRSGMRLVDGGAFTGDTYETLTRLGAKIDEWYAFEPDLDNFKALARVAHAAGTKASLFPCGLSDQSTDAFFAEGEGAASHVPSGAAAASSRIRVLALDDTLVGVWPNYIKLDIEGFEAEALRGMRNLIQTAKPALAVCIYHKPSDLWELPNLVKRLMPDAKLYVRQHGFNGFDTVLYAVADA